MNILVAKMKRKSGGVQKVLSSEEKIWKFPKNVSFQEYEPSYKLENDQWYKLEDFSENEFENGIVEENFDSTDLDQISVEDFGNIKYLCAVQGNKYYFQKITASLFVNKKWLQISDAPKLETDKPILTINKQPDAIYDKDSDTLYFRDLAKIKVMFKGIDSLYREATQEEVNNFFDFEFVSIAGSFSAQKVKTMNRKRIAMALDTYKEFSADEQNQIINYTKEYCTDVPVSNGAFEISSEEHLKLVCFGIEQRFYTTRVGNEKRVANSVAHLGS